MGLNGYEGYPMMGYGGYGDGFFHPLAAVFCVVVLVVAIVMVVRMLRGKPVWHQHGKNDALSTLRERYARGEIDREEFEQKKKDLSA